MSAEPIWTPPAVAFQPSAQYLAAYRRLVRASDAWMDAKEQWPAIEAEYHEARLALKAIEDAEVPA